MKLDPRVLSLVFLVSATCTSAFTIPSSRPNSTVKSTSLFPAPRGSIKKSDNGISNSHYQPSVAKSTTAVNASSSALSPANGDDKEEKLGLFTFKTPYGYLNPYGIYYGLTSILLGIPWYFAITFCQLLYKITNNKVDKMKRLPTFFSHCWGITLLRLTGNFPKVEGYEHLRKFYKEGRAAMVVANHNSWLDIPSLGITTGWRNYKLISKVELNKVPILGKAIQVGGHVMVDRSSRRSQIQTFKEGMKWLQDGVHLCAFPEGTRSKDGHLLPFKNGAFKMAHKVGAPVVCFSIIGAGRLMPANWMFPRRPAYGSMKVIIHPPIESNDKTEKELAKIIRDTIISGLPEEQHPLDE